MLAIALAIPTMAEAKGVYQDLDPNRTYYLCSSHQAHTYFTDSHIALRYAAEFST